MHELSCCHVGELSQLNVKILPIIKDMEVIIDIGIFLGYCLLSVFSVVRELSCRQLQPNTSFPDNNFNVDTAIAALLIKGKNWP